MKTINLIFFCGALGCTSPAFAEENPDSSKEWNVHDLERPHPEKVANAGAVIVKPPSDAVILFDGSDLSKWRHTDGKEAQWSIKDNTMIANDKGSIQSRELFGDCQIHLEWRIPSGREVAGQKGGNSGVYIMWRYEVQIQESFMNATYADGQASAIYGQFPPLVNASAPQGEWQSYDIVFRAPRYDKHGVVEPAQITVLHNGIITQNAVKLLGPTKHKKRASYPKEHPEKAPIALQWHGDPIEFRNIWTRHL